MPCQVCPAGRPALALGRLQLHRSVNLWAVWLQWYPDTPLATLTAPETTQVQTQVGPVHSVVHNVSRKTDARCNGVLCDIPTLGFTCDQAVVHAHKDKWCTVRPAASFVCYFFIYRRLICTVSSIQGFLNLSSEQDCGALRRYPRQYDLQCDGGHVEPGGHRGRLCGHALEPDRPGHRRSADPAAVCLLSIRQQRWHGAPAPRLRALSR